MGTIYNFVCKTCKVNYNIDKIHNARWLIPILTEIHLDHEFGVYSEHSDECVDAFEDNVWCKVKSGYQQRDPIDEKLFDFNEDDKILTEEEFIEFNKIFNAEKLLE